MHDGHGYLFNQVMRRLNDLPDDATEEQIVARERPARGLGEPGAQYGDERFWAVFQRMRDQGCTLKGALAHAYIDVQARATQAGHPTLGKDLRPGDAVVLIRAPEGDEDPAVARPPRVPLWHVLGDEISLPQTSHRRFQLAGGGHADVARTAFYYCRRAGVG
jgi:hypothetical protein